MLAVLQQPPGEVAISSDNPQEKDGSVFTTSGNVVILYEDITVNADWVRYDEAAQTLEAGEVVHFERGGEKLDGDHLAINLRSKAGTIRNARGNLGPHLPRIGRRRF